MRRYPLHRWATIPAAIALVGAAVAAAQPYLSRRLVGGNFLNPGTGNVGGATARTDAATSELDARAAAGGSASAAAVEGAALSVRTAATRGDARDALRDASRDASVGAARSGAAPSTDVGSTDVASTGGLASRLGRYAAPALPLGAAGLFAGYAGSRDAFDPIALSASGRVDRPAEVALGGVATTEPVRGATDVAAISGATAAVASLSSGGGGVARSWVGAAARQAGVVRDAPIEPSRVMLPVALVGRQHGGASLDGLFENVLTSDEPSAADALLPPTGAVPPIVDIPASAADAPPVVPPVVPQVALVAPEPATIALVGGGLLLLAAARRRRSA